jgi:hypothetical protein
MNAKFIEEAILCEARWKKLGLFKDIQEYYQSRQIIAVLMESQRLVNELPGPQYKNYWLDKKKEKE